MAKTCLILDLDETLICSVTNGEMKQLKKYLESSPDHEKDLINLNYITENFQKFEWPVGEDAMDSAYVTYERPGLQDFLDFAFENFNVYIWTAGGKEYAVRLVENIIMRVNPKKRDIKNIHFNYHCEQSKYEYNHLKDLRMFWKKYKITGCDKTNTFIVDDNEKEVARNNPENCIFARPFDIEEPTIAREDRYLGELTEALKMQLKEGAGISSVTINEKLRMKIPINKKSE
jgi:TFIIF-interacting CTD phosphatase-like protein